MGEIDIKVISEWWDALDEEGKAEAMLVLDILSDNESSRHAWLQMMVNYFGARFVRSFVRIKQGKSMV